ncbi:Peptidase C13 family protein [Fasciola gigantica]|uniref:Peptidase C13 family protein n=1 Tax=Fasciola gigantica TaxID=46835 RepID=A0A504YAP1_FASGI|nr:Peptidase C13 family protein [Fasciola gigantica]
MSKCLSRGPEDNVFVYFSDHGTRNLFAFPTGVVSFITFIIIIIQLWATDLNDTLTAMKEARRFNKLVIYMEACYSGSMFENILPSNISGEIFG